MRNFVHSIITVFLLVVVVGCASPHANGTRLTIEEHDVLQNYHASSAMVERAARICLYRQLTKAEVLHNTGDAMRREVKDNNITFYFAPSQWWTLTFDTEGKALTADITGKKIARHEAEGSPNQRLQRTAKSRR